MMTLSIQQLKDMSPGELFASGTGIYPEITFNRSIRWVAVRGEGYHDWAIYYHTPAHNIHFIAREGDKMFTESIIRMLVPCDDEAWDMYRIR